MNTVQTLRLFSRNIPERTVVPVELAIVCLWSALGLVVTALAFAVGFGVEVGQLLAAAG
jgi:hypothetical protein